MIMRQMTTQASNAFIGKCKQFPSQETLFSLDAQVKFRPKLIELFRLKLVKVTILTISENFPSHRLQVLFPITFITRMHSSRMRTGRTLTVFRWRTPPPPKIWKNPPPKKYPPPQKKYPPSRKIPPSPEKNTPPL